MRNVSKYFKPYQRAAGPLADVPENVLLFPIYGHLCIANRENTPEFVSLSRVFPHSELATDCLASTRHNAALSWMAFGLLFCHPLTVPSQRNSLGGPVRCEM